MAKTLPTGEDPARFIDGVADEARREDARALCGLLADVVIVLDQQSGHVPVGGVNQ